MFVVRQLKWQIYGKYHKLSEHGGRYWWYGCKLMKLVKHVLLGPTDGKVQRSGSATVLPLQRFTHHHFNQADGCFIGGSKKTLRNMEWTTAAVASCCPKIKENKCYCFSGLLFLQYIIILLLLKKKACANLKTTITSREHLSLNAVCFQTIKIFFFFFKCVTISLSICRYFHRDSLDLMDWQSQLIKMTLCFYQNNKSIVALIKPHLNFKTSQPQSKKKIICALMSCFGSEV